MRYNYNMSETPPNVDNIPIPNKPTAPKELGRVDFAETPLPFDVKAAQTLFPDSKHLKLPDGNEYILDKNGRTIILFEKPTEQGFTSVYSPLQPRELRQQIARLPEEQQRQLAQLLHLPDVEAADIVSAATEAGGLEDLLVKLKKRPVTSTVAQHREPRVPGSGQGIHTESSVRADLPPADLPDNHFVQLSREEFEARRREQWEAIKELDDNDPRRVVYLRRFTEEYRSSVPFNPKLTAARENPYQYYVVDTSKMGELPKVEPYRPSLDIPKGAKVGMVIGYHHLEKPWGHLFTEMLQQQAQYDPSQIEFIFIQNKEKPTGEQSPASDREIQEAVRTRGITHVIDVHEQLATLNHYMDSHDNPQFREARKSGSQGEYTLDPFVPTWMIEQYYQGRVYPQLQYGVNDQIKKVEALVKGIGKEPQKQ